MEIKFVIGVLVHIVVVLFAIWYSERKNEEVFNSLAKSLFGLYLIMAGVYSLGLIFDWDTISPDKQYAQMELAEAVLAIPLAPFGISP